MGRRGFAAAAALVVAFTATFCIKARPWKRNVTSPWPSTAIITPVDYAPDFFDQLHHTQSQWVARRSPFQVERYVFPLFSDETLPLLFVHGHGGLARQAIPMFSAVAMSVAGKLRVLRGITQAARAALQRADERTLADIRMTLPPGLSLADTWVFVRDSLERKFGDSATEMDVAVAVACATRAVDEENADADTSGSGCSVADVLQACGSYWLTSANLSEKDKVQYLLGANRFRVNYKFPQWRFGAIDMQRWPSAFHGEFVEMQSRSLWNALSALQPEHSSSSNGSRKSHLIARQPSLQQQQQAQRLPQKNRSIVIAFSMGGVVALRALAGVEWREQIESQLAALVLINTPVLVHPMLATAASAVESRIRHGLRRLKAQGDGIPLDTILVRLQTAELDEAVWGLHGDADLNAGGIFKTVFTADLSQLLSSLLCHGDAMYNEAAVVFYAEMLQILGDYATHQLSREAAEDDLEQLLGSRGVPRFSHRKYDRFIPRQTPLSLPVDFLTRLESARVRSGAKPELSWWLFGTDMSKFVASLSLIAGGESNALAFPSPTDEYATFNFNQYNIRALPLGAGSFKIYRNKKSAPFLQLSLDTPPLLITATLVAKTSSVTLQKLNQTKIDATNDYFPSETLPPCSVSRDGDLRGLSLHISNPSFSMRLPLRLVPAISVAYPAAACVWRLLSNEPWPLYEHPLLSLDDIARHFSRNSSDPPHSLSAARNNSLETPAVSPTEFKLMIDLPTAFQGYLAAQVLFGATLPEAPSFTSVASGNSPSSAPSTGKTSALYRVYRELSTVGNFCRWIWSIVGVPLRLRSVAAPYPPSEPLLARVADFTAPLRMFDLPAPELNWDLTVRPSLLESKALKDAASRTTNTSAAGVRLLEQAAIWPRLVLAFDEDFGIVSGRYISLPTQGSRVLEDGGVWRSWSRAGAFHPPNSNSRFATYRRSVFALLRHDMYAEYPDRKITAGVIACPLGPLLLDWNVSASSGATAAVLLRGAVDRWWRGSVHRAAAQVLRLVAVRATLDAYFDSDWLSSAVTAALHVAVWVISKDGAMSAATDDSWVQREIQPRQPLLLWLLPTLPVAWALHEFIALALRPLGLLRRWTGQVCVVIISAALICLLPWELQPMPVLLWVATQQASSGVLPLLAVTGLWRMPDALGFCFGWRVLPWQPGMPRVMLWAAGCGLGLPARVVATIVTVAIVAIAAVGAGLLSAQWLAIVAECAVWAVTAAAKHKEEEKLAAARAKEWSDADATKSLLEKEDDMMGSTCASVTDAAAVAGGAASYRRDGDETCFPADTVGVVSQA